jgi:membrane-bound metal-dependent hydrolase YbcI (DUF457 family)
MKEPGHIAGAYLVTQVLLAQLDLNRQQQQPYLILGTLAGILPDLDILAYMVRQGSTEIPEDFDHHGWISHTFPFYLVPGALIYWAARLAGQDGLRRAALFATASACGHILQDAIGSGTGIMWAWPLSRRKDGIVVLDVTGKKWAQIYSRHPVSWVERLLIATALLVFVWRNRRWRPAIGNRSYGGA